MRGILPLFLGLLLGCALGAHSAVTFSLQSEITLPDSVGFLNVTFRDLNGDGHDEVLIDNDELIASYSLASNQTVDYFLKKQSSQPIRYAVGVIDSDSLLDYVEITSVPDTDFYHASVIGLIYLSEENFCPSDTIRFYYGVMYGMGEYIIDAIDSAFLKDFDGDGSTELYWRLVINHIDYDGFPLVYDEMIYWSFRYSITDDTTTRIDFYPNTQDDLYCLYDDITPVAVALTSWPSGRCYHSQLSCFRISLFKLVTYIEDSLVYVGHFYPGLGCYGDLVIFTRRLLKQCIGDAITESPRFEMLTLEYQSANCVVYYGEEYDTSSYHMICYDLSSPDTIQELWNVEYVENPHIDLIFSDDSIPDSFFTFRDSRIYLHNSVDGAIVDSSETFDPSIRMVSYRAVEPDGSRYLIGVDGQTLKFYAIDNPNPVFEREAVSLPASFSLGDPYPNPYNARLTIPVEMNRKSILTIEAFNILGQKVDGVFSGPVLPGKHEFEWDCDQFPSGIYFISAETSLESATAKAVLIK
jgi:hypothetical protein